MDSFFFKLFMKCEFYRLTLVNLVGIQLILQARLLRLFISYYIIYDNLSMYDSIYNVESQIYSGWRISQISRIDTL